MPITGKLICTDTAILRVSLPPLPRNLELEGRNFEAKSEFHVTLVGREILRRSGFVDVPGVATAIAAAATGLRLAVDLTDEFRLVIEGDCATIIRMCSVSGAEDFYGRLEAALGGPLVRPPHHITLYTWNSGKGIGIATAADLAAASRPLTEAEQRELMRAIT